jgi:hypothetical protein
MSSPQSEQVLRFYMPHPKSEEHCCANCRKADDECKSHLTWTVEELKKADGKTRSVDQLGRECYEFRLKVIGQ